MPDQPILKTELPESKQEAPSSPTARPPTPLTQRQVPPQRWQIFPAQKAQAKQISKSTALSPLLSQVLINRGIYTPEQAWEFLDPETLLLPSPLEEFPDLNKSLDLLVEAVEGQKKILICGDYDADGMTSTALLMRSLRYLGAQVDYAIPSRMDEGYGINERIVQDFHKVGGSILLTVDNGIAAYEPIALARKLGLTVILTDHHEVPEKIPPANAILNPKLIDETSPYRGVAGVGVAYILAVCLAQRMGKTQDLTATLLALFTLGTIADLAPLTGVNRRWVKRGLKLLPKSRISGVQALIEVAGLSEETDLKPEAIGFRLGPRINAVGRIADPQIVIDLLITDDIGVALQRAMQCEEANKLRRQMCEIIELQAVEWVEAQQEKGLLDLKKERVLLIVQPEWHHGVIGIVASRLVERYGVPVFIGTYEDKAKKEVRGSARSIPEFNVFEALQFCDDLLGKYGGHRAAGGFSFEANKLRQIKSRLSNFACQHLQPEHLKPLVTADVQAPLTEANLELYSQIDRIHPCGIENPEPVFWTANATVVEQKVIGKTSAHLKLTIAYTPPAGGEKVVMKAIAWRWGQYYPLPRDLDIAYKLRINEWKGRRDVELELVGVRPAKAETDSQHGIKPWSTKGLPQPTQNEPGPTAVPIAKSTAEAARAIAQQLQQELNTSPPKVGEPPAALPDIALPYSPATSIASSPASPAYDLTHAVPVSESSDEVPEPELPEQPDEQTSRPIEDLIDDEPAADDSQPEIQVDIQATEGDTLHVEFYYGKRRYNGTLAQTNGDRQLSIKNDQGHLLQVRLSDRQGVLHLPGEAPQAVDVSDVKYFNLVRAGLSAIEVRQKTQLLIKKDDLLAEKDGQIATLKAQIELLEEKIIHLSAEQQQQFAALETERQAQEDTIHGQEARIEQLQVQAASRPPIPPAAAASHDQPSQENSSQERSSQEQSSQEQATQEQPTQEQPESVLPVTILNSANIKQQVRADVGDGVWFCLQAASQKDLQAAYRNYQTSYSGGSDTHVADCSEAGICLGLVVEREVLSPFFNDLYDFLRARNVTEIGGHPLGPNRLYSLDRLPPLLADQWRAFAPKQLKQAASALSDSKSAKVMKVKADKQVSGAERALIVQFLSQWEHPMASCFSQKGRSAASSLAQISQLCAIASRSDACFYQWQYNALHQLMVGKKSKGGLLRQIFAV